LRSPLKEYTSLAKTLTQIKNIIPPDSFIHSTGLYAAELELKLAADRRMVFAHSTNWLIYEFWKAVINNPQTVAQIALDLAPIPTAYMFKCYQEDWPWYDGTEQRAALTFLLNRYSSLNMASAGELKEEQFQFHYITQLSKMRLEKSPFDVVYHRDSDTKGLLEQTANEVRKYKNGYMLLLMRKYIHDYYDDVSTQGYDVEHFSHQNTHKFLLETKDIRWVVAYKNSAQIRKMYGDYNITMIDKYGNSTADSLQCEKMIIANF
tara:strand:- start:387 stop:1175 length:789 start_codon:yes stop_codon:yes gene_type:complete